MADETRLKTLIPYIQQHGFVWGPSPEIYGGVAGFYTYGPNGCLLKRKVEGVIRRVFAKEQIFEVQTPTVMPNVVWEASGHLRGFTDPLIKDVKGNIWRADKLIEEYYNKNSILTPPPVSKNDMIKEIQDKGIRAPNNEQLVPDIVEHSLMMHTKVGLGIDACNRPETATVTYLPFLRYKEHFRGKLPFGVYQIGSAYRNEISPRQHLMRLREFTQAEAQIFVNPSKKNDIKKYHGMKQIRLNVLSFNDQKEGLTPRTISLEELRNKHLGSDIYAYAVGIAWDLYTKIGIPEDRMRLRQHGPDEKAFYAVDAWDIEINLPTFGWYECVGIHDRGDYDLSQHARKSGGELSVFLDDEKKKVVPHIIEIAFGVDRIVFSLLDIFYEEKKHDEGKSILKLPYHLAPVSVSVMPLVKKLRDKATEVFSMLQEKGFIVSYDESASIGKRYLRAAFIGTPYCVTIDFDTLEDNTVTVRDRDTEEQERISIDEVARFLSAKLL